MKNIENRLKNLENSLIPKKPDRTVIMYIVDEEKEYWIEDKIFVRPDDISHEDFVNELKKKDFVSKNIVIIGTVRPSDDGKRLD